jgi:threonine dehydratase
MKESLEKAQSLADDEKTFIHPFADPDIVAGQGTIALEILKDLQDADMIIVPVGGGGLISGIALAAKSLKPEIKIIGVQADVCRSAYDSLRLMKIIKSRPSSSIADGILVSEIGKINFEIMQKYVDDIVLVKESEIAAAILVLLERKKVLAEGAGAVSLAAVMNRSIRLPKSGKTVLLISGGNVDGPILGRIISQGLMKHGRIMRLYVHLEDRPGSLARLLSLLAGLEANVLNIFHERFDKELSLYVSRVQMEVETKNTAHIRQIRKALANAGYIMD